MLVRAEELWRLLIEKGQQEDENFEQSLYLQPGATDEQLDQLENTLGVTLPEELKCFYRIHNGQDWKIGSSAIINNLTLMPISQIIDTWTFLQEEFDPGDDLIPEIEETIKPVLWNPKWIPIAENGGGDNLCLDTDPTEFGTLGQVISYWHDCGDRSTRAKSLFAFIENYLNEVD
ncbi:SMI1/KNR4 family protein [Paenibacillus sp. GSMTC-2017]|uniref:SMI1/KNR4 family protein n=1 Tax=Paenibacillus sp. GSMTC-2017 TaxID=2794350 RepID=UPI0018D75DCD|nr:SMI1/KNR4 family protein [Paenibacillus sp. GSMTC-2017]MBH5317653.1 SMI1/KNR4 family protein [Paenibacillus sp. GSMTC-2017]